MSAFTVAELEYLTSQPLMRFASASASGRPDVAPVVFEVDGSDIVTAGFDITHTVRYKNIQSNPRVSLVIDDLASMNPWSPRGIKITGTAIVDESDGSPKFRISPDSSSFTNLLPTSLSVQSGTYVSGNQASFGSVDGVNYMLNSQMVNGLGQVAGYNLTFKAPSNQI